MKLTLTILISGFIMVFACCNNKLYKKEVDSKITAIRVYSSMPVGFQNGVIINDVDSITIFYYKKMVMYENYSKSFIQHVQADSINNAMVPASVSELIKKYYIGTQKNAVKGNYIDPANAAENKKVSMDSVFSKNDFFFNFDKVVTLITGKENLIVGMPSGNGLLEKYVPKAKLSASYEDTSYLYYSSDPELKKVDFSYSPKTDSIKNKKLYKVVIFYKGDPNGAEEYQKVSRQMSVEFKLVQIENENAIKELFETNEKLGG